MAGYGSVSIAFLVRSRLDLAALIEGRLEEIAVDPPWLKDYDSLEPPESLSERFDLSTWRRFDAFHDDVLVGRALVALIDGEAWLWDIRVDRQHRHTGIGKAILGAVDGWCRDQGHKVLNVETQDINVAANRFYRSMGFVLVETDADAYDLPEVKIVWQVGTGRMLAP